MINSLLVGLLLTTACGMKLHPRAEEGPGGGGGTGGSVAAPKQDATAGAGGESGEPEPDSGASGTGGGVGGTGGRSGGTGGTGGRPDAGGGSPPDTGGMPPSGVTVTINGMAVPKEKVVVFLHIGHSDMCGRATGPGTLMPFFYDTDPKLWVYEKGARWRPAKEPTACPEPGATRAGPGMAILKTALAHAPDTHFVSIGHGHSGSSGGYCPNFRRGGLFYGTFMDAAKELEGKVTWGGIYTMFGITEYHLGTPGLMSLADCIVGIANEVRQDLGDPEIPLMAGDWNMDGSDIYSPNSNYGRIARPQLQMVPGKTTRAALIPTDGLPMQDDRHLNMAGHKMWAERGFMLMREKGWAPWASVP